MAGTYVNVICSSRAQTFKSIVKILTNHKLQKEEQTNHPDQTTTTIHMTQCVLRGRECFQGRLRINTSPSLLTPSPLSLPPPFFIVYLAIWSPPHPQGCPLPDWYNGLKMGHNCNAQLLVMSYRFVILREQHTEGSWQRRLLVVHSIFELLKGTQNHPHMHPHNSDGCSEGQGSRKTIVRKCPCCVAPAAPSGQTFSVFLRGLGIYRSH